jgi:hypothetical protein
MTREPLGRHSLDGPWTICMLDNYTTVEPVYATWYSGWSWHRLWSYYLSLLPKRIPDAEVEYYWEPHRRIRDTWRELIRPTRSVHGVKEITPHTPIELRDVTYEHGSIEYRFGDVLWEKEGLADLGMCTLDKFRLYHDGKPFAEGRLTLPIPMTGNELSVHLTHFNFTLSMS